MILITFYSSKDAHNLVMNSELESTFDRSECGNNHLEPELSLSHTHTPIPYSTPNAPRVLKIHIQLTDTRTLGKKKKGRSTTLLLPIQHAQK